MSERKSFDNLSAGCKKKKCSSLYFEILQLKYVSLRIFLFRSLLCLKLLFDIAKICLCAASEAKAIYFVLMVFQYDGASIETEPLTCCPMVAL